MLRRQFVQLLAALGTGTLASVAAAESTESETVTYRVKGFSCVTCAVGLDTMLQQKPGIAWSKSTYPEGIVTIKFDAKKVAENSLPSFIAEMGFTVSEERKG